jgi:hypothetical protein
MDAVGGFRKTKVFRLSQQMGYGMDHIDYCAAGRL